MNERYHFGDLRINRINSIYRLNSFPNYVIPGYLYGGERYTPFFERSYSRVLILFVFLSVILPAMQVGIGLDALGNNEASLNASYGVALFSMLYVLALVAPVAILLIFCFVFNLTAAVTHARRDHQSRRRMNREQLESQS
jgi:uncharacterized membrane protein